MKLSTKLSFIIFILAITISCVRSNSSEIIDISKKWQFSSDENNIGMSEKWYSVDFNDSKWAILDAGKRWEDQGYPDFDNDGDLDVICGEFLDKFTYFENIGSRTKPKYAFSIFMFLTFVF